MRRQVKMGFEHLDQREPKWTRPPPSAEEKAWRERYHARDRYRVMVFARPVTSWSSLAEAQQAAIRLGHGTRCERRGLLFMTVPAWLQRKRIES